MDTAKPSRRATLTERVAAEIRAEMGRQQVRNAALAELLGVSEMWVSRKIRGVSPLTLAEVERIAEVLEVEVPALFPAPARPITGPLSAAPARAMPVSAGRATVAHVLHPAGPPSGPSGAQPASQTTGGGARGRRRPTIQPWTHGGVTA